jgi:hypothetical protein
MWYYKEGVLLCKKVAGSDTTVDPENMVGIPPNKLLLELLKSEVNKSNVLGVNTSSTMIMQTFSKSNLLCSSSTLSFVNETLAVSVAL